MTARDPDPRNQLGSLPPEAEARCAEWGAVFAVLCSMPEQDTPFLVSSTRPLSVIACEALPAADRVLARSGARLAVVEQASCAVLHGASPVPVVG